MVVTADRLQELIENPENALVLWFIVLPPDSQIGLFPAALSRASTIVYA